MNPNDYQKLAMRTKCPQPEFEAKGFNPFDENNGQILHGALGISGEGGEIWTNIQRWGWYGKPLDIGNIKEELGDLVWYVAEMCDALGLRLSDVMEANIRKLQARFPEKFDDGDGITDFTPERAAEENRDREVERRAIANQPDIYHEWVPTMCKPQCGCCGRVKEEDTPADEVCPRKAHKVPKKNTCTNV